MSYRERNNKARMKNYNNRKIQEEALKYEKNMIIYHNKETNDITFHWRDIPEEWLFESNYVHEYNVLRKKRLLKNKNNNPGLPT